MPEAQEVIWSLRRTGVGLHGKDSAGLRSGEMASPLAQVGLEFREASSPFDTNSNAVPCAKP
jgi:hypothetical protein